MKVRLLALAAITGLFFSFFGCGSHSTAPIAPSRTTTLNVSVPSSQELQASFLGSTSDILLYKATQSNQTVTGSAGPFSDPAGSGALNFTVNLPSGGTWLLAVELVAASNQQPLAVGAAQFDTGSLSGGITLNLGSVSRNCYQTDTWMDPAGSWFSFQTDALAPVTQSIPVTDIGVIQVGNGFQILAEGTDKIQYLGNGPLVNFAAAPSTETAVSSAVSKSAAGASVTTLQAGDVYCVLLSGGGHAWMQINNAGAVSISGPSFRFRVNTSVPYYAYERTTADTSGPCPTPFYTPTSAATNTPTLTPSPSPTQTPVFSFTPTITPTPQPALVLSWNDEPSSQNYIFNQANVTGIQVVLKALGQEPISVTQIGFGLAGSIGSAGVVAGSVKLYPDTPADDSLTNGLYTVSAFPTPVASGSFSSGLVTFAGLTNLVVTPGAPQTLLLVMNLNVIGGGNFLNTIDASGLLAEGATSHTTAIIYGGPFNGNLQSVSAATATPTTTPTSTVTAVWTNSPTFTSTNTPTSTSTVTPTTTSTTTPTFTGTSTASFTATSSSTYTPTTTVTFTTTLTSTETMTATPTETQTNTPTQTTTSTITDTPTISPTSTETGTDTQTFTITTTYTVTNSPTDTLTPTGTFTPTSTITPGGPVYIPDVNLLNAIDIALGYGAGTPLSLFDMANLTSLTAVAANISNLEGLEYAVNLTSLDLQWNNVSSLVPLTNLTGLTSLNLESNQINDLTDLSLLTNLVDLDLDSNQIKDVTVLQNLYQLEYLGLDNNQITDFSPLTGLTNLIVLELSGNQITNIPDGFNLPLLTSLYLQYNQIVDLQHLVDGGNPTNGAALYIQGNPLVNTNVPFEIENLMNDGWTVNVTVNIPDPNLLSAIDSALSYSDGTAVTPADLATITSLTASSAGVTSLSGLEYCTALTYLELGNNNITDVSPIGNLAGLNYLDLNGNQITDLSPLSGLTHLNTLYLEYNGFSNIYPLSNLTTVNDLDIYGNQVSDITALQGLTNIYYLEIGYNQIIDLTALTGLTNLYFLDLSYNYSITELQPLLNNTGLGNNGTTIYLYGVGGGNVCTEVPELQSEGCNVYGESC